MGLPQPTNGIQKEDLVIWKSPVKTPLFALFQLVHLLRSFLRSLKQYSRLTALVIILVTSYFAVKRVDGGHQLLFEAFEKQTKWCLYWIGLGVLSSIGLGTGLHTFLLYLGPHIASVTLAAHECGSLNFPEPPYPDEIVCPSDVSDGNVSILDIMSKVRIEAFMWGVGTALGELPPYFMAKAARLSGQSLEDVMDKEDESSEWGTIIQKVVEKAGFLGILACASIPNPLFDLAGITCGHFLIPFWTFFGATVIGKAVIKMMLQKLFVIVAFNEQHFETFLSFIRSVPVAGKYLNEPFREFLVKQKQSLHRSKDLVEHGIKPQSWISWIFEKFVVLMIIYFIISIINSMAQLYHARIHKKKDRRTE